jgi:hypothetical protein
VSGAAWFFPDREEFEKQGFTPDVDCLPTQKDMKDDKGCTVDPAPLPGDHNA